MAYHFDGKAIFSTHNGQFARREKIPSIRTILRSNPIEDQQTMVAKLQHEFPEVCKAITSPVTDRDVYEYFDYCDATVQGFEFLRAVLEYIARINASVHVEQATSVQAYVGRWKNTNAEAFTYIRPYHAVSDLFTREDIAEYGVEFLAEAMVRIKRLKAEEDGNEARESAVRLQSLHTQMMQDQSSFIQPQAPTQPPFPITLSSAQNIRASSNPERGQPHPQGGLPRHLPAPPGQYPAPQLRLPLPRLTPSTELLEHMHPGSTSRGNFHSDPVVQDSMNSYTSGPLNNFVAVPSRGLPGPFSYPPTRPIPLLGRMGTFGGNLPRGKKNPKKKSSDDARMAAGTENGSRQASSSTNPKQDYTSNHVQMPFHPRSSTLFQDVRPSPKAARYSGSYHPPNLPPGHHSSNRPEWFHYSPRFKQAPIQTTTEFHSSERAVSSPFSPSNLSVQGPTQDPRHPVPNLPVSTDMQHQNASAGGQLSEENLGSIPAPVRPQSVEHQLPDHPFHFQHEQDHIPDCQRAVLAPVSNVTQAQYPTTSLRSGANGTPRHPVLDDCKIWIGGIPNEMGRDGVIDMLRPCRGLIDLSRPKVSSPSRNRKNHSYAFARFQNPTDAAEALERLPQTRFPSLPEGTFLITDYAKISKVYASPSQYLGGTDGASKQPVSSNSPTKSRKDQDTNHTGKSKTEHGRRLSKGSAQGRKQPAGSSEGKSENPSECVLDADEKDSNLQSNEAIKSADPDGKEESTAHERQSFTKGLGPMPPASGLGGVQSDAGADLQATKVSRIADNGAHDASSLASAKLQVQARSSMSSRHTEGRSKPSKKKSKGLNKLSVHEKQDWEPPRVRTASGNAGPKARTNLSVNGIPQAVESASHTVGNGDQAENENESSRAKAPIVPLEPTSISKDLENADETFLGCEATEDDGGEPKSSVANVGGGTDGRTIVSETALPSFPFEQSEELASHVMRRYSSNSTQGSIDTTWSLLSYPGPPASSQTEGSSSISQECASPTVQAACPSVETAPLPDVLGSGRLNDKLEASILSSGASQSGSAKLLRSACEECRQPQEVKLESETSVQSPAPGETPARKDLGGPISLSPFEMEKGAKAAEELPNPTKGDVEAGLIEENPEHASSRLSKQPSPSKADRSLLKSPARKRAPSIPPRSSSLASPSTPIKTHRKKKPRNLTPVTEASPTSNANLPADPITDPDRRTLGSRKLNSPILSIDPAPNSLTTDKLRDLPKPETPFLMDDGVRVNPPKISRQLVDASTADRYYAQKNDYQVRYWSSDTQTNEDFYNLDSSGSASTHPSEGSISASANEIHLETILREAGYRSLSSTSPFTIKGPELAFFESLAEQGKPLDHRTNTDGPVLTWLDEKGKIGHLMSLDAWTKQHEMIEVVKKATAAKRLLADSPPPFWTSIESLRQKLSRFIIHDMSDANSRHTTNPKTQRAVKAEALLKKFPQRDASIIEMQKWSRKVSLFMEQNASGSTSTDVEIRESTTSTSPRRRQQEQRHPIIINEPELQPLAHKLGRDDVAFETAVIDINDSRTSGQTTEDEPSPSTYGRRTPSEEGLTPSEAIISPTATTQVTQLEETVEAGEDRRHRSNDRLWSSNPAMRESMINSHPGHESFGAESEVRGLSQVKDVDSEQESKEMENKTQQPIHANKPCKSKGQELSSNEMKEDQKLTAESENSMNPISNVLNEKAIQESEGSAQRKQNPQQPQVSVSSFESNQTTNNKWISDEKQRSRPRSAHSPLKRSAYNAVAGRGIDGKLGGNQEASKDPWALPQGEKPWGCGGEGRGKKNRRGGR